MKNQNETLAWVVISLSLAILTYVFFSIQPYEGQVDIRGPFILLFLIPIGIAVFFLGRVETMLTGFLVVIICSAGFVYRQYLAVPYLMWPQDKGFYAYLDYMAAPLFKNGVIWELGAIFVLSYLAGFLSEQLKIKSLWIDSLSGQKENIGRHLADEKRRTESLEQRYSEDINRLNSLVMVLSDLAKELPSVLKADDLFRLIVDKAAQLLSAKNCAMFYSGVSSKELVYICSVGYDDVMLKALKLSKGEESGIVGWCAKTGKFLSIEDAREDSHMLDILRHNKFAVTICQPITQRSGAVVLLCVDQMEKDLKRIELIRILSLLSNLSAIAIDNAILMEKIRQQALTDSLTGLYNHKHFYQLLEEVMPKARKEGATLGIFMIDIDHFKEFNDMYGHQSGDFILQETAGILKENIQQGDIASRYGGEEFAVLCIRKDIVSIKLLAEALRKSFEQKKFQYKDIGLKITISIGVAFYDYKLDAGLSADKLVKRSDDALYRAKNGGRNMVCVYQVE